MRTLLVTGSDTGVGKTRVVAALARLLAADGSHVQLVKPVETGRTASEAGDAVNARDLAGVPAETCTLAIFEAPLAPAAAAALAGVSLSAATLVARTAALPPCDWRIVEGAGGIATPVDATGADWADFGAQLNVSAAIVVVPDRLGAINQARLALARAAQAGLPAGVWLNAAAPADFDVAAANRSGLAQCGVPCWAVQGHGELLPAEPAEVLRTLREATAPRAAVHGAAAGSVEERCAVALVQREADGLRRRVRPTALSADVLNLADNDYLALAHDPVLADAAADAARRHGTSASASPLITGWTELHESFVAELAAWHGLPHGLLWSSGHAANTGVLGVLPQRGDLVFADRLVHQSMIAGLLQSGARLQRYEHLRLDRLEPQLARAAAEGRTVFVVTESVFSMDGDAPDLAQFAELKRRYGFFLVLDEAHALGWYGPAGAGLASAAGIVDAVDVLVGTLGKTLGSGGAYTLFRSAAVRDHVANHAGEFIYSTALSPVNVAVASAALGRVRALAAEQPQWHRRSREFRAALQRAGWSAPDGDAPIVPVCVGSAETVLALAETLRAHGVLAAAVRPPTVPAGTSRLRFSLKRTFNEADTSRVLAALAAGKAAR